VEHTTLRADRQEPKYSSACQAAARRSGACESGVEVHGRRHVRAAAHAHHHGAMPGHGASRRAWNSNASDIKDGSVTVILQATAALAAFLYINDLYKDGIGAYPYRELFTGLHARDRLRSGDPVRGRKGMPDVRQAKSPALLQGCGRS